MLKIAPNTHRICRVFRQITISFVSSEKWCCRGTIAFMYQGLINTKLANTCKVFTVISPINMNYYYH